jgi:uncharacterized protein YbgA (DUF1722 family)
MPHISIEEFLNAKFSSISSLITLDTVVSELNDFNNVSNSHSSSVENNNNDTINAQLFMDSLKEFVKNPSTTSLHELDVLIAKYGRIPAITYTKELVIQKLKLINERKIRTEFIQVLDKLNDFEIFELNNIDDSIDYITRVEIVDKVFNLRKDIDTFKLNVQNCDVDSINHDQICDELYHKLLEIVSTQLLEIYKKSLIRSIKSWDEDSSNKQTLNASSRAEFKLLLDIQIASLRSNSISTFWALDCITEKFKNKFIYHFEGNGETNRIDKPEFAFNYIIGYLRNHLDYAKNLFATTFATSCINFSIEGSFSTWFITSTIDPLRKKFKNEISILLDSNNNHLLSHFVTEVKKFDEQIKQEFAYIPIKGKEWDGLTDDLVLSRTDVWNAWLQNEKNFVNDRFEEIVEMEDAFAIEYDVVEIGMTKPTKSAINLKNLLEGITLNYDKLPLKFQLKFLSEVQLKLLNFYFDTLKKGLHALKTIKHVQVDGISTLERICRIWCSSKYIIEMMDKWSEETIFIELWESLNTDNSTATNKYETTFFESVINGYNKEILNRIPMLISGYFERQLNRTMKEYFQENTDWTFKKEKACYNSQLDFVIQTLSTDLEYLQKTVSKSTSNTWQLLLSDTVASYFEKNVALVNNFSIQGAEQLENDVNRVFKSLNLVQSYNKYWKLISVLHVLRDGKVNISDTQYPPIDDSTLAMLVMRRK